MAWGLSRDANGEVLTHVRSYCPIKWTKRGMRGHNSEFHASGTVPNRTNSPPQKGFNGPRCSPHIPSFHEVDSTMRSIPSMRYHPSICLLYTSPSPRDG